MSLANGGVHGLHVVHECKKHLFGLAQTTDIRHQAARSQTLVERVHAHTDDIPSTKLLYNFKATKQNLSTSLNIKLKGLKINSTLKFL